MAFRWFRAIQWILLSIISSAFMVWAVSSSTSAYHAGLQALNSWWNEMLPLLFASLLVGQLACQIMDSLCRWLRLSGTSMFILNAWIAGSPLAGTLFSSWKTEQRADNHTIRLASSLLFAHNPLWLSAILITYNQWTAQHLELLLASYYLPVGLFGVLFYLIVGRRVRRIPTSTGRLLHISPGQMLSQSATSIGYLVIWNGALMVLASLVIRFAATCMPLADSETIFAALVDVGHALYIHPHEPGWALLAILAWGGVSTHLQWRMQIEVFSYRLFVVVRLLHVLLSTGLFICFD